MAVIFSTVISAFQNWNSVQILTYNDFFNSVIWNNFSISFLFSIVLIGGYMIDHEYTDDTLKNIMAVPVSIRRLLFAKLICAGIISVLLRVFSFICTFAAAKLVLPCTEMELAVIGLSFVQICLVAFLTLLPFPHHCIFRQKTRRFFISASGWYSFMGFAGYLRQGDIFQICILLRRGSE